MGLLQEDYGSNLALYNLSNSTDLGQPSETQYEYDTILPFLSSNLQNYVNNVKTQMFALKTSGQIFPLTINQAEYDNSHVCSPFTRYITYGKKELLFLNNKMVRNFVSPLLSGFGMLLKAGNINQVACVNNWLLSTNLYPNLDGISINKMTQFLIDSFPTHTTMFPSLNFHTNRSTLKQLLDSGYQLVPSREIFIFDQTLKDYANRRCTKTDFDLLKKTPYQIVSHQEITENDYDRIAELYHRIYIKKYPDCNPQFSSPFFKLCHQKNLLNFQGLREKEGNLIGFIASCSRNNIMTTQMLGYDDNLPVVDGLYRLLTALSLKEALAKGFVFNMSGGAAEFKKRRGGVGFIEYNAVYTKHLPFYRRQPWDLLRYVMTEIGIPWIQKYKS